MDFYDIAKIAGVSVVSAVIGSLKTALQLKPKVDNLLKDVSCLKKSSPELTRRVDILEPIVKTLKEEGVERVKEDISKVKERMIWDKDCKLCKDGLINRLEDVVNRQDRNYSEVQKLTADVQNLPIKILELLRSPNEGKLF
jgi:hypothetical protein